jgi:hypothetical protein
MKLSCFKLFLLVWLGIIGTASATSYTLSVTNLGSGTVTKNPTNSSYPAGVTVIVTATPDSGWYFAGWSGDTNGTVNPLNVTVESDLVITGNFLPYPVYTLTLVTNGQGTIALNPAGGSYLSNSLVAVTATPASGWVFAGWSEASSSSANPLSLTMDANLSLTGTFAELPFFDQEPISVTNTVGSTVSFSAHATGTGPLAYQWFFNNGSLTGATDTTLTLTNVSPLRAGNYQIIVTNDYGSATSSVVSLTLTNPSGSTNVVYSADEGSLRAALSIGGWVSLAFNGTLTLTNTIEITNNVSLDGKNVAAIISGGNAVQLFSVAPGVTFSVTNVTLADGSCIVTNEGTETPAEGGAICNDGGSVILAGCTLTNDTAQSLLAANGLACGGALFNNGGTVSLFGCSIFNNEVVGGIYNGTPNYDDSIGGLGLGGALYNTNGSLIIVNCLINSNSCTSAGMPWTSSPTYGGALYEASGLVAITNSRFNGNLALGNDGTAIDNESFFAAQSAYGGALAAIAGTMAIENSRFSGNTAHGGNYGFDMSLAFGGAVYNTADLQVRNSSFSGNQASSGGNNYATDGNDLSGNGGALYNLGTAALNGCVIYSNIAQGGSSLSTAFEAGNGGFALGGGIFNAAQLAITNCTLALNSVVAGSGSSNDGLGPPEPPAGVNGNALGGGLFNSSGATFTALNITIASNYCVAAGPGFSGSNGVAAGCQVANTNGTLALHNSIIAYGGTNGNAYGVITDDGYNISSDGSANLDSGLSYSYTDPLLGPLANYGGPILCMALLPGSPAIDSADSSDFPPIDQRGYIRPIGAGPDIGAYEYGSFPLSVLALTPPSGTNNLRLSFTAAVSNVYVLQGSTNLFDWINLSTNGPFASPTSISQTINTESFPARYFRLMVH